MNNKHFTGRDRRGR